MSKSKIYYKNHKIEISARKKKQYKTHKKRILENKKKYYEDNKIEILAKKKVYYKRHRYKILKSIKNKYKKNPEKFKNTKKRDRKTDRGRNYYLKYNYGIDLSFWNNLFCKQNRRCAICKTKKPVDLKWMTDHKGKKVRGILCRHCNLFIGLAQESIDVLKSAIKYLQAGIKNE